MASALHGYVTDKVTGAAITDFVIHTSTGTVFDSDDPNNPYKGTNYYHFPHPAGTIDVYCNAPGYLEWARTAANGKAVTLLEGRTKRLDIKMTPEP